MEVTLHIKRDPAILKKKRMRQSAYAVAGVIAIIITIVGAFAYAGLPTSQFPDIVPPTISVTTSYPGANAITVADTVAYVDPSGELPVDSEVTLGVYEEPEVEAPTEPPGGGPPEDKGNPGNPNAGGANGNGPDKPEDGWVESESKGNDNANNGNGNGSTPDPGPSAGGGSDDGGSSEPSAPGNSGNAPGQSDAKDNGAPKGSDPSSGSDDSGGSSGSDSGPGNSSSAPGQDNDKGKDKSSEGGV